MFAYLEAAWSLSSVLLRGANTDLKMTAAVGENPCRMWPGILLRGVYFALSLG